MATTDYVPPRTPEEFAVEVANLALAIADDSSRFDLDFGCATELLNDGEWINTGQPSSDALEMSDEERGKLLNQVLRALRYLSMRGQIQRHPLFPHFIRFIDKQVH